MSPRPPDQPRSGRDKPLIHLNLNITIRPKVAWLLTGFFSGGAAGQVINQMVHNR